MYVHRYKTGISVLYCVEDELREEPFTREKSSGSSSSSSSSRKSRSFTPCMCVRVCVFCPRPQVVREAQVQQEGRDGGREERREG